MTRKTLVWLFLAAILVSTAVPTTVNSQNFAADWPKFRGNLASTGFTETTSPDTNATLWTFNTGGQVGSPYYHNGVVYVGSYDRNIYAFNASNGSILWKTATGSIVISRPMVAEGKVFVGSEDYRLYALNASNGEIVWSYQTGYYVDSDPAYNNGIVYVGSEDGKVYAFDAESGEVVWSYQTGNQIMLSSVTLSGGLAYIGSLDQKIYALNAANGELVWSYTTDGIIVSVQLFQTEWLTLAH